MNKGSDCTKSNVSETKLLIEYNRVLASLEEKERQPKQEFDDSSCDDDMTSQILQKRRVKVTQSDNGRVSCVFGHDSFSSISSGLTATSSSSQDCSTSSCSDEQRMVMRQQQRQRRKRIKAAIDDVRKLRASHRRVRDMLFANENIHQVEAINDIRNNIHGLINSHYYYDVYCDKPEVRETTNSEEIDPLSVQYRSTSFEEEI